jgi:beta-hydroxylase
MSNFLNPEDFTFLAPIKKAYSSILNEFNSVSEKPVPWTGTNIYNTGWEVFSLKYKDAEFPQVQQLFPVTNSIFQSLNANIYTCGFSILKSGCEIYEHVNYNHDILRCHFCLKTNFDCALIVNDEVKRWTEGEFLIFDDTKKHSAYNRGTTDRIVILFDFYKNQ